MILVMWPQKLILTTNGFFLIEFLLENLMVQVVLLLIENSINVMMLKKDKSGNFKNVPENAIACQKPDEITWHWPHWVPITEHDKYHHEAFHKLESKIDGTYELCGPKINSNHEKLDTHILIKHWSEILNVNDLSYEWLKAYLQDPNNDIEEIVFHHKTDPNKMCKIRKGDFGIKRM